MQKEKATHKEYFIVSVFDDRMPQGFARRNVQASIMEIGLQREVKLVLVIQHALKQAYASLQEQEQHCIAVHVFDADPTFHVIDGGSPLIVVDFTQNDNALLAQLKERLLAEEAQHV